MRVGHRGRETSRERIARSLTALAKIARATTDLDSSTTYIESIESSLMRGCAVGRKEARSKDILRFLAR
jgi:hypothetical protein